MSKLEQYYSRLGAEFGMGFYESHMPEKYKNQIFHYTSPFGFMSILTGSKDALILHASRYDSQNDMSEGKIVMERYQHVCKQMKDRGEIAEDIYKQIEKIAFLKTDFFSCYETDTVREKRVEYDSFICSFSKNSDSLAMWNYYSKGNAYEGFNIGMDIPSIEDSLHMMYGHQLVNVDIYSIVYDSVKQEKMIEDFLREVLAVYQEGDLPCLRYLISHQLTYWSLIFKSQFFQHEEEVRIIVHVAKNRKEGMLQNDPIDIKYRINGGYIIPFIEMKLDKSVVCSVSLGPLQRNEQQKKKQQEILQEMLKRYGYSARVMCSQIPVRY